MKLAESLRTLLILGRVSNLPTVWSNLLTGWFLASGEERLPRLALLLCGGSLLYVAGMYLNDYCDAAFDAQFCKSRPIPSGKINRSLVGLLALVWFIFGMACLTPFGLLPTGIALGLTGSIVLYDFHHKNVIWAPVVMGLCRFLLYPLAGSAAQFIPAPLYPVAIALGLYVAGITYVARGESRPGKPTRWALILLIIPLAIAFERTAFLSYPVLLAALLLLAWMAWLLIPLWQKTKPSIGRVVSGLLAGIVLVDILALATLNGFPAFGLFPLFGLALLLQRVIPAT